MRNGNPIRSRLVLCVVSAAFLAETTYAVPGPLISGGVGLISNAAAIFAVTLGFLALFVTTVWNHVSFIKATKPKAFYGSIAGLAIFGAFGLWQAFFPIETDSSPYDELRTILAQRAQSESKRDSDVPLSTLTEALEISNAGTKFPDSQLEEEIAYSIGRNNNVVWNRYLSAGKVPTDENTLSAIKNGLFEIPLEKLFENGVLSKKYQVVDLRTELEFTTSAHLKNSVNTEYRAIVNDEFPLDRTRSYVFVCHDGAADLSRSLIATAYLRSKGYDAYALRTGMRPILDRLGIPPARYSKRTDFRTYSPATPPKSETFVDTLGALGETLSKRGYRGGIEVVDFPFYKLTKDEYGSQLASIRKRIENGEDVRFACYDTFSCFYSRIFIESHSGSGSVGMGIFR